VTSLAAADLRALHSRAYHPRHVVIAAAGRLDHEVFLKLLARSGWFTFPPGPDPVDVVPAPASRGEERKVPRDGAQTHVVMGTDAFSYRDPRRYALLLLNNVLGGGMSSQLFQRVREELGLAYSVFAFQSFYHHGGVTGVYVGTHPSTAAQAVEAIHRELARLAGEGLDPDTLAEAKQQLKGQVTLSLESPSARMYRLAGFPLHEITYRTIDEALLEIDAVTRDDIAAVAAEFFDPARQTTVWLGPH
jgi:predicted Zn-dependent peptidase